MLICRILVRPALGVALNVAGYQILIIVAFTVVGNTSLALIGVI